MRTSQSGQGSHDAALLLTYSQASQRLAVSQMTIRRLVESGKLQAVKIGGAVRITSASVALLAQSLGVSNAN